MAPRIVRLLLLFAVVSQTAASKEKTFSLLHAVNGRDFVKRGSVVLDASSNEKLEVRVENDASLDTDAVEQMMDTGLYQIKVVDENEGNVQAMTSVSACDLRRANFRDEITLTLGPRASVLSVTYTPLVSPLAPPCEELVEQEIKPFQSKISYETDTPGMAIPLILPQTKPPPGLKFFPRSQSVAADRIPDMAQEEQHQSFLRKYWYVILPLFLIGMVGPGAEEPAQPQQAQGGGAAAQPVSAAVAPAGGGGGGTTTRRRGKRN